MSDSPFIVAELSASHLGNYDRAMKLVRAAAAAGANAIKLQTWATMSVCKGEIEAGSWRGWNIDTLYRMARTPWEWHASLFRLARDLGMVAFSAPFDEESALFLESIDCPIYKIASFEITHLDLIRKVASFGKPMILSTGMASEEEIEDALHAATIHGARGVTLLHCVSAYPAPVEDMNLLTIAHLAHSFDCDQVGLSDHTRGSMAAMAATVMGVAVIEKHINLEDRAGPDGAFAATPQEFAELVTNCARVRAMMGEPKLGVRPGEQDQLQFRRSCWVIQDALAGEEITEANVAVLRPLGGMEPARFRQVLGLHFAHDVCRGQPLTPDCLDEPLLST